MTVYRLSTYIPLDSVLCFLDNRDREIFVLRKQETPRTLPTLEIAGPKEVFV